MWQWLVQYVPPEGIGLVLVIFLSLLIGLEIEERRETKPAFFFGGIRTYPLIALTGFLLVVTGRGNFIPFTAGILVLGVFLSIVYWTKVGKDVTGFTTEISALATYVLGGVVGAGYYWLAVSVAVIVVLLVHMKIWLEGIARKLSGPEVATFTKFLLITAVILPMMPDRSFTQFNLNPYRTWLIVIAVSGISYGSYLLQWKFRERAGVALSALLGGVYSSTMTTVVMARKSKTDLAPALYTGGILLASSMMYLRVVALLLIFSSTLFQKLLLPFIGLSAVGSAVAAVLITRGLKQQEHSRPGEVIEHRNPLEFSTAFLFAAIFLVVTVVTRLVVERFGSKGLFGLAGLMGLADVDPFILSLTQPQGQSLALAVAAQAIVAATAANNLAKGFYALLFGERNTGRQALLGLAALSLLSLLILLLLR